jgi:lipoate-protein ligase A
MPVFPELDVYEDTVARSGALNMAVDEALLEQATRPAIRFYHWDHPALSFGYFGKFSDIAQYGAGRDLVRRWTGGGIVFHGEDLTYTIVIPASAGLFGESSNAIYAAVHLALCEALNAKGSRAELAGAGVAGAGAGVNGPGYSETMPRNFDACFARPVPADVMLNGNKVAGAAHRRTRRGLLHQGSIQNIDISNGLAAAFAERLSGKCAAQRLSAQLCARASEIAVLKYGTENWLQRR